MLQDGKLSSSNEGIFPHNFPMKEMIKMCSMLYMYKYSRAIPVTFDIK
jgi:hypothetical protein